MRNADIIAISDHRLSRFHGWALLWLKWIAAFLDKAEAFAPLTDLARAIAHQWIDRYERVLRNIILIRAARRLKPCNSSPKPRPGLAGFMRALFNKRMRAAFKTRGDLRERLEALAALDLDAMAAMLLKRLPRGLTRRRPIRAKPAPAPRIPVLPFAPAPTCADTS